MEKVINKIKRVLAYFAKERLYTDKNDYLKKTMLSNHKILIDYFYDDIIEMIMSIGNINFSELNRYHKSTYNNNCNLTKESIAKNFLAYDFLFHPFTILFWWSKTKQGHEFWQKQQILYSEHIKQIMQLL